MSCAISSYASTLTAQIYAKQKLVTLKNGSSALLLVAMPKTPTQSDLRGAEREAKVIQDTFEGLMDVKLQKLPPVKRVLEDLPIYRYVFFACHGFADPQNPFRSGLLLCGNELGEGFNKNTRDSTLTVETVSSINHAERFNHQKGPQMLTFGRFESNRLCGSSRPRLLGLYHSPRMLLILIVHHKTTFHLCSC